MGRKIIVAIEVEIDGDLTAIEASDALHALRGSTPKGIKILRVVAAGEGEFVLKGRAPK